MKILKRKDSNEEIKNNPMWEDFFVNELKKGRTWKDGYSAYELADYIFPKEGNTTTPHTSGICSIIAQVFNVQESAIKLDKAVPECKIKFDQFRHPREHDLAIWGRITRNGKTENLFIGIEAKVDESFGDPIGKYIERCKKRSKNTNIEKRICGLSKKLGLGEDITKIDDLYYQLFYFIAGCVPLDGKDIPKNGEYVSLILNFSKKSKSVKQSIEAYNAFIKRVNNDKLVSSHVDIDGKKNLILSCDVKFGDFCVKTIFVVLNPSK